MLDISVDQDDWGEVEVFGVDFDFLMIDFDFDVDEFLLFLVEEDDEDVEVLDLFQVGVIVLQVLCWVFWCGVCVWEFGVCCFVLFGFQVFGFFVVDCFVVGD